MPAYSLQKRGPAQGLFLSVAAGVIVLCGMTTIGGASVTASGGGAGASQMTNGVPGAGEPVQFADEITRRLRRMGINFSRTQLPHPYDPIGEVC